MGILFASLTKNLGQLNWSCLKKPTLSSLLRQMVKIFVGNLSDEATEAQLQELFKPYGEITECAVLNRFGFVVSFMVERSLETTLKVKFHEHAIVTEHFGRKNDFFFFPAHANGRRSRSSH